MKRRGNRNWKDLGSENYNGVSIWVSPRYKQDWDGLID